MCSDVDSCLTLVADAYWNTAKGCEMSYIIPHSEIMLQISEMSNKCSIKIITVCTFCKSVTFLFCVTAKKKFHPFVNVTLKQKNITVQLIVMRKNSIARLLVYIKICLRF